ncbi:MAG: hypothetical protein LCH90_17745 [Proteobacteria bacterium]|nr:hypothetical protein [Pseudomonadota bacterium]
MKEVKVGDSVSYDNGRGSSGQGVVTEIRDTLRGPFYVIKSGESSISVRRAHIKA